MRKSGDCMSTVSAPSSEPEIRASLDGAPERYQIIFVKSGTVRASVGDKTLTASDGDVILYDAGAASCEVLDEGGRIWRLALDPATLQIPVPPHAQVALGGGNLHHVHIPDSERAEWTLRWRHLSLLLRQRRQTATELIQSLVRSMLFDIMRLERAAAGKGQGHQRLVGEVLRFIDAAYFGPLTLRELANHVGLSPAYLTHVVCKETGFPVHHWVIKRRILAAQHLLVESDLTIAAIAAEVGFRDTASLCRQFCKITGCTPTAWRTLFCRQSMFLPTFEAPDDRGRIALQSVQTIIDVQPALMAVRDGSGCFIFTNHRWREYTGLTFEKSRGWGWLNAVHPDDVAECIAAWRGVSEATSSVQYYSRLLRAADSTYRWHLCRSVPLRNPAGQITMWCGNAIDVQDAFDTRAAVKPGYPTVLRPIERSPINVKRKAK